MERRPLAYSAGGSTNGVSPTPTHRRDPLTRFGIYKRNPDAKSVERLPVDWCVDARVGNGVEVVVRNPPRRAR
jgi:hypothetical protein